MIKQITISTKELAAALALMDKATPVSKKTTSPILRYCLVSFGMNEVIFESYNLNCRARVGVGAEVSMPGDLVIDRTDLAKLLKKAKSEKVDKISIVNSDTLILTAKIGEWIEFLNARPVSEWPEEMSEFNNYNALAFDYSAQHLADDIAALTPAISKELIRYYLNGVCFHIGNDGALTLVATDGHRAAIIRRGLKLSGADRAFIIPRDAIAGMACMAEAENSVCIELDRSYGRVTSARASLIFKMIDAQYPDFTRIERPFDQLSPSLDIAAKELAAHCKTTVKHQGRAYLTIETDEIGVRAGQVGLDSHVKAMSAVYNGVQSRISINAAFLSPYTKLAENLQLQANEFAIGGEVETPVAVRDPSRPHLSIVIMPARIGGELPALNEGPTDTPPTDGNISQEEAHTETECHNAPIDPLADLAARVAALESKLAAIETESAVISDSPPLAEYDAKPARPSRDSRLHAVKLYLALRAKRAALVAVQAENAALLVQLESERKARQSAELKRRRSSTAAWRRNKAAHGIARKLSAQIEDLAAYKARAAAQYEKAQTEGAATRRLLDKARQDLTAVTLERDRQAVAIGAIAARIDRIEQGQGRAAA